MDRHLHEHLVSIEAKVDLVIALLRGYESKEIAEITKRLNAQTAEMKQATKEVSDATKGD